MINKSKFILLSTMLAALVVTKANADEFPLGASDSQVNNVNSQQMPNPSTNSTQPQIVNSNQQLSNAPTDQPPVTVVQQVDNQQGNLITNSDKDTADLNSIKRQKLIAEEQKQAAKNMPQPTMSLSNSSIPSLITNTTTKPTTAVMTGYVIFKNKKTATIKFADNSMVDVSVGDHVAGYKVNNITEDYVSLTKYDKTKDGAKNVKVYKVNYIPNQTNNQLNFGSTAPAFDMDSSNKN